MKKIYLIIIVLFLFAVNHRSIHADTNSGLVQADLSLITKSLIDIRYGNFTGYSLIRNNQKINISGWKSSASNPFSESALAQNEFSIFKNYKCIADIAGIISAISGGYYLFSTLFPSDSYNYTVKLNSGITVISFLSSRLLYSISIPHLFKFVEYNNKYLINGEDAISEIFKQKKSVSSFSKKWLFSISANYNDFTPKGGFKTTEDVVSTNDLPLLKGAETLFGIPGPSPLLSLGVLFQRNLQSFSIGAEVFYNPMKIEKSYDSLLHAYDINGNPINYIKVEITTWQQTYGFCPYIKKYFGSFYISTGADIIWFDYGESQQIVEGIEKIKSVSITSPNYKGVQALPQIGVGFTFFKNKFIKWSIGMKLSGNAFIIENGHSALNFSTSLGY